MSFGYRAFVGLSVRPGTAERQQCQGARRFILGSPPMMTSPYLVSGRIRHHDRNARHDRVPTLVECFADSAPSPSQLGRPVLPNMQHALTRVCAPPLKSR
jgi:hypothetical protein